MKFMVTSNPSASRPSEMRGKQAEFWDWFASQKQSGTAEAIYVKAGRGVMIVVNVPNHEALHRFITEWGDRIVSEFTIIPLIDDPAHQERIAREGART